MDPSEERFRTLYESGRARLIAYALRRTASPEDAADVVAETFTISWRRIDDVPMGEASMLWLYATARRVIANHHRQMGHRADVVERIKIEAAHALTAELGAVEDDTLAARTVLSRLPEDDREVLMLAGWEGLDSAALACVLGCSPTAARLRLHRARRRLSEELTPLGETTKQERRSRHLPPHPPISEVGLEES